MNEKPGRILLIEDNPSDAYLFQEMVSGSSGCFELVIHNTLAAGLAAAENEKFNVVFLDLSLPDSQGMDTVRRTVSALRIVPVVVLTGLADDQIGLDSLRAGAQDYLTKDKLSLDSIARSARYAIERNRIVLDLHEARDHLEDKVQQRTAELAKAIDSLQAEVRQRLAAEANHREAEMEVLRATEREQRRLGRDLHDSIQGTLTGIDMMLKSLLGRLGSPTPPAPDAAAKQVQDISDLVRQVIRQTRGLSRGLAPLELTGSGLRHALALMAETVTSLFGVECTYEESGEPDMSEELVAGQIYYIVQEATTNALKHARCKHIEVILRREVGQLVAVVRDNGVGMPKRPRYTDGMGLKTMNYRAKLIGAFLSVEPRSEGGTAITLIVPEAMEAVGEFAGTA